MCAARDSVQVGSQRLRVRVSGPRDGRPLLFLNGIGAPLEMWEPLVRRLPGVQAITFDAPGSGGSPPPLMPMSIAGYARLGLGLLDHLGHAQADVIGLSFGGMVAQELTHRAPARVGRLILAATSCGWGAVPGTPAALMAITTPERYYSRAVFERVARDYIGGREGRRPGFLAAQARIRASHPPTALGYTYQLWAAAFWSSLWWLPDIDQPTLVLAGEADPLVPAANADLLGRLLPHAVKHLVPDGGHLCLLDQAARLAPVIARFLLRPAVGPVPSPDAPRSRVA